MHRAMRRKPLQYKDFSLIRGVFKQRFPSRENSLYETALPGMLEKPLFYGLLREDRFRPSPPAGWVGFGPFP